MSDTLKASIGELKRQVQEKVDAVKNDEKMAEIIKNLQTLNALEDHVGEPITTLSQVFKLSEGDEGENPITVKPDEYYGLIPLEAAKKYLKREGKALHIKDIANGIRAGGCNVRSEGYLARSLTKSTREIAVVGDDHYGLVEFYPHIARTRSKKGTKIKTTGNIAETNGKQENETEQSESQEDINDAEE